jgi:MFS family permease
MKLRNRSPKSSGKSLPPLRKNRDFMLLWTGAGFAAFGRQIGFIAFPLLMIFQEGSPAKAGLVSFAGLLPMLVIQLPAGAFVDRWDRRRTMILCDLGGFVAMGAVGLAVLAGHIWLPLVMAAAFAEGCVAILYRLAEQAAVRNVVQPGHLSQAMSQNEARGRAADLLGQPAGTALFAVTRGLPFGVAAVGHLIALVNLLLIRVKFQTERTKPRRALHLEIAEGFTWLWGQRFVRTAIACVAGSNLLFQILTLTLYVIIKDNGGSPATIGVIGVVMGLGGVAGALSGSVWLKWLSPTGLVVCAFLAWTLLTSAMAFTVNPVLLGVLFGGTTFVGAALNVSAGTIMVRIAPDEIRGRAMSVAMLLASGANSLGALLAGFLLARYSTSSTALGVGGAMLAITIVAGLSPAIRHPDIPPEADEDDEPADSGPTDSEPAGAPAGPAEDADPQPATGNGSGPVEPLVPAEPVVAEPVVPVAVVHDNEPPTNGQHPAPAAPGQGGELSGPAAR